MDNNQYKSYITKEYQIKDPTILAAFIRVDMIKHLIQELNWPQSTTFKGAANLYFETGYIRELGITKDADLSILSSLNKYKEKIIKLFPFTSRLYEYKLNKVVDHEIATSFYDGFGLTLSVKIIDSNIIITKYLNQKKQNF